jgi:hypothetical protein
MVIECECVSKSCEVIGGYRSELTVDTILQPMVSTNQEEADPPPPK